MSAPPPVTAARAIADALVDACTPDELAAVVVVLFADEATAASLLGDPWVRASLARAQARSRATAARRLDGECRATPPATPAPRPRRLPPGGGEPA